MLLLPFIHIKPEQFVGRLFYLAKWAVCPTACRIVMPTSLRWVTNRDYEVFERTGKPNDAILLADCCFFTEKCLTDAMREYVTLLTRLQSGDDDWHAHDSIVAASHVLGWINWLAITLFWRFQQGSAEHRHLSAGDASHWEQRLASYLVNTCRFWYDDVPQIAVWSKLAVKQISDGSASVVGVKKAIESLFTAAMAWNQTEYHTRLLVEKFYQLSAAFYELYSAATASVVEGRVSEHGAKNVFVPRRDMRPEKLIGRFLYLSMCREPLVDDLLRQSLSSLLGSRADAELGWQAGLAIVDMLYSNLLLPWQHVLHQKALRCLRRYIEYVNVLWDWHNEIVWKWANRDAAGYTLNSDTIAMLERSIQLLLQAQGTTGFRCNTRLMFREESYETDLVSRTLSWLESFAQTPYEGFLLFPAAIELGTLLWQIQDYVLSQDVKLSLLAS